MSILPNIAVIGGSYVGMDLDTNYRMFGSDADIPRLQVSTQHNN
jgi:hypothetical protein